MEFRIADTFTDSLARLTGEEQKASRGRSQPEQRQALGVRFERDAFVAENAKRRAKGLCELCGGEAPFSRADSDAYPETHHVVWLTQGSSDTVENTAALCPNCHRKMHVLKLEADIAILRAKTKPQIDLPE